MTMNKKAEPGMIVGLDIGTSKIVAIVGEVNEDNELEVIGVGSHASRGLKKGVVVNIESTVQSMLTTTPFLSPRERCCC